MSLRSFIVMIGATIVATFIAITIYTIATVSGIASIAGNLYDNTFVGMHYAHIAEIDFARFADSHRQAAPPYSSARDVEALQTVLTNLDVAIERATTPREQQLGRGVRSQIADLLDVHRRSPPDLAGIDHAMSNLVQHFAARALDMRASTDDVAGRMKARLLALVGLTLVIVLGCVLALLGRIAPALRDVLLMIEDTDQTRAKAYAGVLQQTDEIGAVARALQSERAKLKESFATLEDRVEARTVELERAMLSAEAASRAKSAFLTNMSHEIRTPLNGVLGMTQAMAADELNPAQRDRLDTIRESGRALLAILNDVLDLSKIDAGQLELAEVEFNLDDLLRGAHATFTEVAKAKGLAFDLRISGAHGVYRGDPDRLRQILYNLLSNALKFTDVGEVRVDVSRQAEDLKISVSDTGIGIAPDMLAKLFSNFTQADDSATRRFGGAGLGLAICRRLTELMGGRISAISEPGRGAIFTVVLPLPQVARGSPAAAPGPAEFAGAPQIERDAEPGFRVLVAEDNAVNQTVVRTLLDQLGFDLVVVENGRLAVEAWQASAFDAILMDIQMPEMDGVSATLSIRDQEASTGRTRTPIIALTANVMAHQVARYRDVGMDGHVPKPIDVTTLFRALEAAIAGEPTAKTSLH